MTTGMVVLAGAVGLAVVVGLVRGFTDGRFRGTRRVRGADEPGAAAPASVLADTPWADQAGERATLLQLSSAFCAPCRATRRILEDVAAADARVVHIEVDAEHHLDLVRALGVMRTPTTLILDADGREVARASGTPTKEQVLAALAEIPDA